MANIREMTAGDLDRAALRGGRQAYWKSDAASGGRR